MTRPIFIPACIDCTRSSGSYLVEWLRPDPDAKPQSGYFCWECALKIVVHLLHWPMDYKYVKVSDFYAEEAVENDSL